METDAMPAPRFLSVRRIGSEMLHAPAIMNVRASGIFRENKETGRFGKHDERRLPDPGKEQRDNDINEME